MYLSSIKEKFYCVEEQFHELFQFGRRGAFLPQKNQEIWRHMYISIRSSISIVLTTITYKPHRHLHGIGYSWKNKLWHSKFLLYFMPGLPLCRLVKNKVISKIIAEKKLFSSFFYYHQHSSEQTYMILVFFKAYYKFPILERIINTFICSVNSGTSLEILGSSSLSRQLLLNQREIFSLESKTS